MAAEPHYFGIRHHGPGCARSLRAAFDALQPDCVLIEGPPESDALIGLVTQGLQPPVALLGYCPDTPSLAVYHPFAVFSPEWQAMRWAVEHGVPVRFIDLPLAHGLAIEQERRAEAEARATQERLAPADEEVPGEVPSEDAPADAKPADVDTPDSAEALPPPEAAPTQTPDAALQRIDPLHWLAQAAGHGDGETWWNQMVEERGDGAVLFDAIAEAMRAMREASEAAPEASDAAAAAERGADPSPRAGAPDAYALREARREAYMRSCVRAARKEGHARIAVVCGAWHVPALMAEVSVKDDTATLKGLPKLKVASTWVPWTYRHLTNASGYGAGVRSPGWYEHLWHSAGEARSIGWLARVARLLRERDLDCSSAHLIEAARLADSLAALRERPAPGLDELNEATRTVLLMGDDAVLRLIEDQLIVGDRLGSVPPDVPVVPLQRDLERLQKSLRLKPEATQRSLDLDLRQPGDLARSQLLHRLNLLDLPWGTLGKLGRSARGTFHEVWTLQWQPEFALRLIEASRYGQTVEAAATARAIDRAEHATDLAALAELVDQVLLAELEPAVPAVTHALESRAAVSADALQMLGALPALANVFRYGNVRQTDAGLVAHVLDGLIVRAAIATPLACQAIDGAAAQALRERLIAADAAIVLRDAPEPSAQWQQALAQLGAMDSAHALLQGLATRMLLDAGHCAADTAAQRLSLHLSAGADPGDAADWLDGFLNRNAQVLLHDATVWQLVDQWLATLGEDAFVRVLPMVRRSFAAFGPGERRDLGQRAVLGAQAQAAAHSTPAWDAARAALPLAYLERILGVAP